MIQLWHSARRCWRSCFTTVKAGLSVALQPRLLVALCHSRYASWRVPFALSIPDRHIYFDAIAVMSQGSVLPQSRF